MISSHVQNSVELIPNLSVNAGPKYSPLITLPSDENWIDRLKEEYQALIQYVKMNKEADNDWFKITSDKTGQKYLERFLTLLGGLENAG